MLELIQNELSKRDILQQTTLHDWHTWAELAASLELEERNKLHNLLAKHTGIPQDSVQQYLEPARQAAPDFITVIHEYEQSSCDKITAFQQKEIIQQHNLSPLMISRAEWLTLINKYNELKRHSLTIYFLIDGLSHLRKQSYDSLLEQIKKEQLPRQAKEVPPIIDSVPSLKRKRESFFVDAPNPLILDNKTEAHIQQALEPSGVRARSLSFASPEKGYANLMATESGKKLRPLCAIRGTLLFKPLTPYGTSSEEARADFRQASRTVIASALPRLNLQRAEDVEFTATLEKIIEREKKRRRKSQNSIMGASARDVFVAHGIAVSYEQKNEHHWAHLIAHFLCDSSEVRGTAEEVTNLIPSTASANYATLHLIELFIRETLQSRQTEKIHIHVSPHFTGLALVPSQLVYTLTWDVLNTLGVPVPQTNVYYINPQSYARITKAMKESIEKLNQLAAESSDESDMDDFDIRPLV